MLEVKNISKLLADIPKGAWVAISQDEERLVAYGADLSDVLKKANEAGEQDPIVTRVPESDCVTLLV